MIMRFQAHTYIYYP